MVILESRTWHLVLEQKSLTKEMYATMPNICQFLTNEHWWILPAASPTGINCTISCIINPSNRIHSHSQWSFTQNETKPQIGFIIYAQTKRIMICTKLYASKISFKLEINWETIDKYFKLDNLGLIENNISTINNACFRKLKQFWVKLKYLDDYLWL